MKTKEADKPRGLDGGETVEGRKRPILTDAGSFRIAVFVGEANIKIVTGRLPCRQVVEQTFVWLDRNRRLAKEFEAPVSTAAAWVMAAGVKPTMRRVGTA